MNNVPNDIVFHAAPSLTLQRPEHCLACASVQTVCGHNIREFVDHLTALLRAIVDIIVATLIPLRGWKAAYAAA